MKKKLIARKYVQSGSPLSLTLALWLAADYWSWPGWVCGIVGFLLVILWGAFIHEIATADLVHPAEMPDDTVGLINRFRG